MSILTLNCCAWTVLNIALLIGWTCYRLERYQTDWFIEQQFSLNGQEIFQSSSGPVPLPIIYLDGSLVGAFYLVDPDIAQSLLPETMEPLTIPWPINKAISGIFMFEFRNTSIGEYGEMGLTIQARKAGSNASLMRYACDMMANMYHLDLLLSFCEQISTGLYVVTLPVTTESAQSAGREIWGFNKYLNGIQSDFEDPSVMKFKLESEFECELDSKGG